MALSIRNAEVEVLARDQAAQAGTGMTDVILEALQQRRDRVAHESTTRLAQILAIAARAAALPVLDARSPEEILGYNDHGAF
jgi:antitoxin VapB